MFNSIFTTTLTIQNVLLATMTSIACGLIISTSTMIGSRTSKSFLISICMLPALVEIVILMVNGNLGAGVAVAGAFSLIRFRSMPGKASDIILIFFSMSIGLITGMGYIAFALVVTLLISIFYVILLKTSFGDTAKNFRRVKIIIPEDLDYTDVFDDIFKSYAHTFELIEVKTTNLGSMYQLVYDAQLKSISQEKKMLDEIRCRNGNLTIISSRYATTSSDL